VPLLDPVAPELPLPLDVPLPPLVPEEVSPLDDPPRPP
jgi:hypothetical protein